MGTLGDRTLQHISTGEGSGLVGTEEEGRSSTRHDSIMEKREGEGPGLVVLEEAGRSSTLYDSIMEEREGEVLGEGIGGLRNHLERRREEVALAEGPEVGLGGSVNHLERRGEEGALDEGTGEGRKKEEELDEKDEEAGGSTLPLYDKFIKKMIPHQPSMAHSKGDEAGRSPRPSLSGFPPPSSGVLE
jgi:hypothetical protein